MMERRLRRIARPLTRSVRAGAQRWDAVGVRREAVRILRNRGVWEIGPIRRARSGTRIARIRSTPDGRQAILKITDLSSGAAGLERERRVLVELAAEPRLEELRPLFPWVLDAGSDGRWSYLIQRALPGGPATRAMAGHGARILTEASGIALRLHGLTAASRVVGPGDVEEWVVRPLATLRELVAQDPGSGEALAIDRLTTDISAALDGASVPVGWTHGDLWSDNVLVRPDDANITGIVDWDSASAIGLALHDQLHLVLFARKLLAGSEIGVQICRALSADPQWDAIEIAAVSAGTDALPGSDEAARRRLGVILYWLRLAVMNLARQPTMTLSRRWLDDNVRAVLACL